MKIKDITYVETNKTRTDGRYPQRIGSEVEFYLPLSVGDCMYLNYISDSQGNPKTGVLRTSVVQNIGKVEDEIIVRTKNSIYYFEK